MKKKILKITGIYLGVTIIIIVFSAVLFFSCSPQFGRKPTKEQELEYSKYRNYKDGQFINQSETIVDVSFWKFIRESLKKRSNKTPKKEILVKKIDSLNIENHSADTTRLTWFGHSTFLLEMDGKKILLDPMLGDIASPISFIGPRRYSKELPIAIEEFPYIDAIILSHDHYDHLDYLSIKKLMGKVGHYYVPLGVGNHLERWGVAKEKIHELNWWESIDFAGISLVCTPARHFSGRGFSDRSATLWASWVIKGNRDNIFFSGDGGYDTHFKEIGDKYGPFDISLMECGQYNEDWKLIHMMPEETVQASIDLRSKLVLPIHWGAFTLAFHDWYDSVQRITKKAKERNLPITTPQIGEPVIIGDSDYPSDKWWLEYRTAD